MRSALWILACAPLLASSDYLGPAVCATCHSQIAASQSQTNMAKTWQLKDVAVVSTKPDGSTTYSVQREAQRLIYRVRQQNGVDLQAPVESAVGGKRHGISFLLRLGDVGGLPLERPALVETRYLYSTPHKRMELSAGFPTDSRSGLETALGRALTPDFERKCLNCHGDTQQGVHCESCHGPGRSHVEGVAAGRPKTGVTRSLDSCRGCHSGFSKLSDPMPEDLLISSQFPSLEHSECSLQSGGAITCTQCHDPHRDTSDVAAKSEQTCAGCHAVEASTKGRCLECHMPIEASGSFRMVDHWIRVHREKAGKSPHSVDPTSKTPPRRELLRMIAVADRAEADALRARVAAGESFFALARDHSIDRTKVSGGYLGDVPVKGPVPPLKPGEVSPVIESNGRFLLLQRFPRDFRWQAAAKLQEAQHDKSPQKFLEALEIYPRFLRALIFLGTTLGEQGNPARAVDTLEFAAKLYPEDAAARYNLGIAYDALNRVDDARKAYQDSIRLEPSLTAAYQNLGADLLGAGEVNQAADVFREGLRQNPLSAILYHNLSLAYEKLDKADAARRTADLARILGQ